MQICCVACLIVAVFRCELGIKDLKISVNAVSVAFKDVAVCVGQGCDIAALVCQEIIKC